MQRTRKSKKPVRILALDLSLKTGWAHSCGKGGMKRFDFNVKTQAAEIWDSFITWLLSIFKKYPVDLIVHEASIHQKGNAARVSNGLHAILELAAHLQGVRLVGVHQSTLKKHATGSGKSKAAVGRYTRGKKKGQIKYDTKLPMLRAAKKKWKLAFTDDNYIDALWLLDYGRTKLA